MNPQEAKEWLVVGLMAFLLISAVVMVVSGWIAYWKSVR